jgi:flagella basal body P-ring formation protein FlgA
LAAISPLRRGTLLFTVGDMETWGFFSIRRLGALLGACAVAGAAAAADGPAGLEAGVEQQVRELALAATRHPTPGVTRVDIQVGQLDPRLRLAPCQRVEPYLPPGSRLWGRSRIGLRCTQGTSLWNVYLPITVKLYGMALVAAGPLAAGTLLNATDLLQAEVDLAEDSSSAVTDAQLAVGRTLTRAVNAGQSVRQAHLKARQWFAAGETVKVLAAGAGFSVAGEGEAITAGMEGQPARVRTESGRVLTGMPVGERRMELAM